MPLRIKKTPAIIKDAFKNWFSRDPFRQSAVIAYNAIFSLPGLMVVIVTLAGYFFGKEIINERIHVTVAGAMGIDTADQIKDMILYAMRSKDSIWATILGIITILVGATGVFVQLQKSLNIIWEVEAKPNKSGIWKLLKLRLFSFGLIFSIAFLLLISLVISTVLSAAGEWLKSNWSESFVWVINIFNTVLSLVIITVLFAAMLKVLPDAKIKWRNVWVGAFVTALLFTLGKTLLGLYFGKAEPGSGYGPAGSIILILLWVSYSSMIFFFGAEFTRSYAKAYNEHTPANDVAVKKRGRQV